MVYEIKWTSRAKESYDSNVSYLEKEWSEKEIKNFVIAVEEKVRLIAIFPELFIVTNKRKHIRKTIINKQIILFYRQQPPPLNRIELLLFWDSRRNPADLKL